MGLNSKAVLSSKMSDMCVSALASVNDWYSSVFLSLSPMTTLIFSYMHVTVFTACIAVGLCALLMELSI